MQQFIHTLTCPSLAQCVHICTHSSGNINCISTYYVVLNNQLLCPKIVFLQVQEEIGERSYPSFDFWEQNVIKSAVVKPRLLYL